jgi:hypothetical protein
MQKAPASATFVVVAGASLPDVLSGGSVAAVSRTGKLDD